MLTSATVIAIICIAVAVGLVVLTSVNETPQRDPWYPKRWTRCHECLDLYEVPKWEVEGFVCGKCRKDQKDQK